jgi:uncharacterized protein (TIGR02147 family)
MPRGRRPSKAGEAKTNVAPGSSGATPLRVSVFDYLDHRAFLRDHYRERKAERGLSFRGFSRRAGLRSPNYLKLVIDGERNLSDKMAERFAQALGLTGDAAAYFTTLVRFAQAKSTTERTEQYTKLTGFRRYRSARPLATAEVEYHATWYLPAVRELAARGDFSDDPRWIASMLWPAIAPADAARALETLLTLGLLVRDPDGRIEQAEPLVSTGAEVQSVHVATYHRAMLERASGAIDDVPRELRDISSLTLCLGKDGLRRLKERVQSFRRELLELSGLETEPRQVVQLNFQLFPLSRVDQSQGTP